MATVILRNVPADLYERLKRSAERHGRSIGGEAIWCLERVLRSGHTDAQAILARARAIRARMPELFIADADLHAARAEGRP